jgi:hypothetical protein
VIVGTRWVRRGVCGDGGGEGIGELVDVFEEVVEHALGLLAAAGGGELWRDGAEEVEGVTDLDEAVVQLVDGLGVFVRILVFVEVLVELVGVADAPGAVGR